MKMKKRIIALLLAVLLAVGLTSCKDVLKGIVHKATGTSDEVQEEDTTRWADATADPLIIQGIADSSAKFAAATADGCLYAVFNGIWSRSTDYFTAPTGSLNIMACGTAEGTQKFKVALWKKVDGGAEYVPDSTYYIHTDGTNYRCTVSGLDPAAQYRVTISYDSSRYYLYGLMKVEGVRLSLAEFLVVSVESTAAALLFETPSAAQFAENALPILYCGIMSSGVAYTLQILGQRDLNPAIASLIMCLESVFSALGGWMLLHQSLSAREVFGCVLIFAAVVLAQLPLEMLHRAKKTT